MPVSVCKRRSATIASTGAHTAHGPPSSPEYPGLQVQAVLPINELENAGQSKHSEDPTKFLYFPAIHFRHTTPTGVHPLSHIHTKDTGLGIIPRIQNL